MAAVSKIDSNSTGLRYAEEVSYGTLPGSPVWTPLEPNTYSDFGGEITTLARNPINADRQRKKGVVTDLDASGGFQTDLTQANIQELLQGFFFADLRRKDELSVATVDGTGEDYEPASGGDGYVSGDLLFAKGFDDSANNGLKTVTGSPAAASVPVNEDLVTAAAQSGTISRVGFQFSSGDAEIDASGTLPQLTTTTKDCTDFGIIPGEWVFIGGDLSAEEFATAANNGFARVRSVTANAITFDKTSATMVTDAGAAKTIRIFFGRVLKNELSSSIVRRSYQLERLLGAPDDASPNDFQSEYLVGAIPSTCQFNIAQADKVTVDLEFVGKDFEQRDAATGEKTGDRPALTEEDAFNTSSDVTRVNLSRVVAADAFPTPLFAFVTDITVSLNNNVSGNKAIGTLGNFEATAGTFEVGGSLTAYFSDVAAVAAVRDNDDVTIDLHLVKDNKGISMDLPLLSLGNGRPNVEQDSPITLPLDLAAATGAAIDASLDYTMLMMFWDYLPTAAG